MSLNLTLSLFAVPSILGQKEIPPDIKQNLAQCDISLYPNPEHGPFLRLNKNGFILGTKKGSSELKIVAYDPTGKGLVDDYHFRDIDLKFITKDAKDLDTEGYSGNIEEDGYWTPIETFCMGYECCDIHKGSSVTFSYENNNINNNYTSNSDYRMIKMAIPTFLLKKHYFGPDAQEDQNVTLYPPDKEVLDWHRPYSMGMDDYIAEMYRSVSNGIIYIKNLDNIFNLIAVAVDRDFYGIVRPLTTKDKKWLKNKSLSYVDNFMHIDENEFLTMEQLYEQVSKDGEHICVALECFKRTVPYPSSSTIYDYVNISGYRYPNYKTENNGKYRSKDGLIIETWCRQYSYSELRGYITGIDIEYDGIVKPLGPEHKELLDKYIIDP